MFPPTQDTSCFPTLNGAEELARAGLGRGPITAALPQAAVPGGPIDGGVTWRVPGPLLRRGRAAPYGALGIAPGAAAGL